ncbi:OmpA family protein [uncultured Draconibacterium sp.]|uniref:OmpA family protein n=1 Tax=uncultured Draconibacterium sp. TaxID=1573823 RepID=UPI0025D8FBAC|nr:OmpA family protein [uncultured Draconibacterium sp.]
MKKSFSLLAIFTLCFVLVGQAQVKDVEKEAKRQGTNRINRKIDKGIDSGFDAIEDGIGSLFGKKKKKNQGSVQQVETSMQNTSGGSNVGSGISIAGKDPEAVFNQYGMFPPDGATDVPIPVTLKWTPMNGNGFKAASYELYLEEGQTNPMQMLGSRRSNTIECKDLKPNTTYSWSFKGQAANGQYMPGGGGTFTTGDAGPIRMDVQWSKFDFVPGDEVIFSDGPDIMEENGEFPSRWDLVQGQVEIANVNGENVIMFLDGGEIIPYLENANEDYLPDVFTIEFDYYTPKNGNRLSIYLTDRKNNPQSESQEFEITPIRVSTPSNGYIEHPERDYTYCENGCWTHVSLAFTKGKLKVYLDDTRLVNIPRYTENPTGFTFYPYFADASEQKAFYAKNFRIAKGGVKYYDRVMTEGKIICNGIRFDVNKATLKPESMGPINKIYELMSKQPDLKFSVEGHTDADGDDAKNQTLSEQRAKAVADKLVEMGISADRLASKGLGESVPIDNNNSPEGKANNRRVEFVKF